MLPVENETNFDPKQIDKNMNEAKSTCLSSAQNINRGDGAHCSDGIRVKVVAEINKNCSSIDVVTEINGKENSRKREAACSEITISKRSRSSRDDMGIGLHHENQAFVVDEIANTLLNENVDTNNCDTHSEENRNSVINIKTEPLINSNEENNANDIIPSVSGTSNYADIKPAIKVEKADASSTSRDSCRFGIRCYRRNPAHRKEEAHPGDQDYRRPSYPPPPNGTPNCPYGDLCYRRNPVHFQQFSHPPETDFEQNYKNYRLRLRQRRQQERVVDDTTNTSNNSSELDEDYDLDDPFINDEQLDSDYIPNSNEEDDEDDYDACDRAEE